MCFPILSLLITYVSFVNLGHLVYLKQYIQCERIIDQLSPDISRELASVFLGNKVNLLSNLSNISVQFIYVRKESCKVELNGYINIYGKQHCCTPIISVKKFISGVIMRNHISSKMLPCVTPKLLHRYLFSLFLL